MVEKQRDELLEAKVAAMKNLLDALCSGSIDLETYTSSIEAIALAKSVMDVDDVVFSVFEQKQASPF